MSIENQIRQELERAQRQVESGEVQRRSHLKSGLSQLGAILNGKNPKYWDTLEAINASIAENRQRAEDMKAMLEILDQNVSR